MSANTNGDIRIRSLTGQQHSAIDLVLMGRTDSEIAGRCGVDWETVIKWRETDPAFQTEVDRRRAELSSAAGDRLRALLPQAIDALEWELTEGKNRVAAATQIIRLAELIKAPAPSPPANAERFISVQVNAKLSEIHLNGGKHLPADSPPTLALNPPDAKHNPAQPWTASDTVERKPAARLNGAKIRA